MILIYDSVRLKKVLKMGNVSLLLFRDWNPDFCKLQGKISRKNCGVQEMEGKVVY